MRICQIEEYPNYFITDDGQVINKKGRKLHLNNRYRNYLSVTLCKNGERHSASVHRLVAEAFIPNPHNYPVVNHKDENPTNNNVDNLEWCTQEYNNNYGTRKQRQSLSQMNRGDCSKKVKQYNKDGTLVAEYPSVKEAWRCTGIQRTSISNCCRRYKQHSAGGYVWEWG